VADRKTILLLAAVDMEQVLSACRAYEREKAADDADYQLLRALETAIVVCYWRPFSKINSMGHLADSDAIDPELHAFMKGQRDQVYAHTDEESHRTADAKVVLTSSGKPTIVFGESWWASLDPFVPRIVEVALRQRDAYQSEAVALMWP
jgi:hypothetical protein